MLSDCRFLILGLPILRVLLFLFHELLALCLFALMLLTDYSVTPKTNFQFFWLIFSPFMVAGTLCSSGALWLPIVSRVWGGMSVHCGLCLLTLLVHLYLYTLDLAPPIADLPLQTTPHSLLGFLLILPIVLTVLTFDYSIESAD
jgi:hypothetical protein